MKALILVDLQCDFCKDGALEVKNGDMVIEVANKMIEVFEKNNNFIIATKDWHPKEHKSFAINSNSKIGEVGTLNGLTQVFWPVHCVQNEKGSSFHPQLLPVKNVVYKGTDIHVDSYSAFFDNGKIHKTELDSILRANDIDTLYVMGLATDYCVKFTVLDALSLGYKVYVIYDGCKGVNISKCDSDKAFQEMKDSGAIIIFSDELV
ncbi:bifunctional nicotinamidase/pyrazinamidase [Fusobacterium hominis]|uniref:Nicotinamidase n=1 Tax=Fusobacterium hominis TaxID=2764326 RepID=A0A7G9GW16_9FUSO|nr:bifunctional nicotinamidase/pyrazinamidase [Fusobacterium hominis]QNM14998.1 bifunctional nicotinamidase/pyrazinamidase [Fusobacterium hominis]